MCLDVWFTLWKKGFHVMHKAKVSHVPLYFFSTLESLSLIVKQSCAYYKFSPSGKRNRARVASWWLCSSCCGWISGYKAISNSEACTLWELCLCEKSQSFRFHKRELEVFLGLLLLNHKNAMKTLWGLYVRLVTFWLLWNDGNLPIHTTVHATHL